MTLKSKFHKNNFIGQLLFTSSWSLFLRIAGALMVYVFLLIITRHFGKDVMGKFAIAMTTLLIGTNIGKLGYDNAMLRFSSVYSIRKEWGKFKTTYYKAMLVVLPLSITLSGILYLASPWIGIHFFHDATIANYLQIASFGMLPLSVLYINVQILRGQHKIGLFIFLQRILPYILAITFLLLAIIFEYNYFPLTCLVVGGYISAIVSAILVIKSTDMLSVAPEPVVEYKKLFQIAAPMFVAGTMYMIIKWVGTLMLGHYRTNAEVGVYNIAFKVSGLASYLLFAVNSVIAPKIASHFSKNEINELRQVIKKATRLIVWFSLPIIAVLWIFPDELLGLFGKDFGSGSTTLMILSLGCFYSNLCGSNAVVMNMTNNQNVTVIFVGAAAIANIGFNILLIPKYGIVGAAIASVISQVIWNTAMVIYIKRKLNVLTIFMPFKLRNDLNDS